MKGSRLSPPAEGAGAALATVRAAELACVDVVVTSDILDITEDGLVQLSLN